MNSLQTAQIRTYLDALDTVILIAERETDELDHQMQKWPNCYDAEERDAIQTDRAAIADAKHLAIVLAIATHPDNPEVKK